MWTGATWRGESEKMSDEVNRMADDPQISIASLKRDIDEMRFTGFWPDRVECGRMVFELLVNWAIYDSREPEGEYWTEERILIREARTRENMLLGLENITFHGMPVKFFDDVPDGRLWPSRERGGFVARPFFGTEAHANPI